MFSVKSDYVIIGDSDVRLPMLTIINDELGERKPIRCIMLIPEDEQLDGFTLINEAAAFFAIDPSNLRKSIREYLNVDALPDDERPGNTQNFSPIGYEPGDKVVSGNKLYQFIKVESLEWRHRIASLYSMSRVIIPVIKEFDIGRNKGSLLEDFISFWSPSLTGESRPSLLSLIKGSSNT